MLISWLRPFHTDDDGQPQGGGADDKVRVSDILERYGKDTFRMAEKLAEFDADNRDLRAQRKELKRQLQEAQAKQPAEGSRILSAEEAALFDTYTALGKPESVKQAMEAAQGATAELASLKRERTIAKAAEAAGYKASVLTTLAGDLDIQVEPVKDGKPLVVVVKDGEKTALEDYAKAHWSDFLPALTPTATLAPDINAGARGNGKPGITEEEREAAQRRFARSF